MISPKEKVGAISGVQEFWSSDDSTDLPIANDMMSRTNV
jgi:hypothetical protein